MAAPDLVAVALRAAGYIAVLQAAGVPLFLWLFDAELAVSAGSIRRLGLGSALAGLLATAAYEIVEPARMAGSFAGIGDASLQKMLLASDAGTALAVRLLGLLMIVFGTGGTPSRWRAAAGIAGGTLVVASFAFIGHAATRDPRWLLTTLLLVHLLIVAFWFGALLPFYLAATRESLASNALVIERFSAVAVWLVPVILVAGLTMAAVLLPSLASLATPYGSLLLVKLGGFAALMGFAALNKWRLGSAIGAGQVRALRLFRHSVITEWVLIAGVVAATAVMTAWFSPGM